MPRYNFTCPVVVRYGDIDAQGHMNHAAYFTFMEHARMMYLRRVDLWDLQDFKALGLIVAEAGCTFERPVRLGETVNVGVRVPKIGNKSLVMEYGLTDAATDAEVAAGRTVLVAYDYDTNQSISVPAHWREKITQFELPY